MFSVTQTELHRFQTSSFCKRIHFFGLFEKRLCLFVPRYLVALKLTLKYFPQWRTLETRRIESETSGAVFASKKKIYRQNKREKIVITYGIDDLASGISIQIFLRTLPLFTTVCLIALKVAIKPKKYFKI